jgi:hypothetical protein
MEKLQLRSDGFWETSSGLFAVSPLRMSGQDSDLYWFDYKVKPMAATTRVRWRKDDGIAVIDQDVARFMLGAKYAQNVSQEQAERWNGKIAELTSDAQEPQQQQEPPVPPVVEHAQEKPEQAKEAVLLGGAANGTTGQQNAPENASEGADAQQENSAAEDENSEQDDTGAEKKVGKGKAAKGSIL